MSRNSCIMQVLIGLCCLPGLALAAPKALSPVVKLCSIKAVKPIERYGDELYLTVTEYHSQKPPRHRIIPRHPLFWSSKVINKISNVQLWSGRLAPSEAVNLVITFIDKDAPPWNVDDLVGEVKLQMRNDNGELKREWSLPNRHGSASFLDKGDPKKFEFKPHGGHYIMTLTTQNCA